MKINIKKKLKSAGSTIKGMGSIDKKSLKNGSYSMGITAIVIAVLVVINLIVGQIPEKYTQVDVSTQKLYTISDTTVKYLKDMNTDVTIYHIVQSGKEDSVLEKMLTRYEEESKHIKVEKKDPVLYPNFTSQYTSDDVADNSLIVVAGEKSKVISYSDLYETEMDYTTYQTNTTGFDGEGQIDSAISYVTSENLPVIYTLEGHEELELNSSLTDSLQKANYDVQSLNLLTQDAVPADKNLVANLVKGLEEKDTAVCYARQLPNENCRIVERYTRSFNYPDESRKKGKADIEEMGIKTFFCSDVCAAYRVDLFHKLGGFESPVIFNEDMFFAAKAVFAGYYVKYEAEAKVIHSHNYTVRQQFHRNFDLAVSQTMHPEIFEQISSEAEGMKLVKSTMKYLCSIGKPYLIFELGIQCVGKYAGYRLGKRYKKLSRKQILKCTMSPEYWKRLWNQEVSDGNR